MSVAAVAGAAKSAAAKPNHAVYLFRHIQTSQVLISLKSSVELNLHSAKLADKKHMLQPRRLRAPQEMNQLDETLVKMVELLNENPKIKESKGNGIQILWEREGVRKQLLEKEGVSLLEGIQHGDLVIKRGRDIANA
ncbi:hypothetical protein BGZ54_009397 [Gamsiella multidivaricata]|nr:hypothetical protein BGZ54_009397 [Gamsiella multidivaricata]